VTHEKEHIVVADPRGVLQLRRQFREVASAQQRVEHPGRATHIELASPIDDSVDQHGILLFDLFDPRVELVDAGEETVLIRSQLLDTPSRLVELLLDRVHPILELFYGLPARGRQRNGHHGECRRH
jgi:hypothetical protein